MASGNSLEGTLPNVVNTYLAVLDLSAAVGGSRGGLCKSVVLANAPSFRFFVPLFRFFVPVFGVVVPFLYPHSGFGGPGNIRQNHPFETQGKSQNEKAKEIEKARILGSGLSCKRNPDPPLRLCLLFWTSLLFCFCDFPFFRGVFAFFSTCAKSKKIAKGKNKEIQKRKERQGSGKARFRFQFCFAKSSSCFWFGSWAMLFECCFRSP